MDTRSRRFVSCHGVEKLRHREPTRVRHISHGRLLSMTTESKRKIMTVILNDLFVSTWIARISYVWVVWYIVPPLTRSWCNAAHFDWLYSCGMEDSYPKVLSPCQGYACFWLPNRYQSQDVSCRKPQSTDVGNLHDRKDTSNLDTGNDSWIIVTTSNTSPH